MATRAHVCVALFVTTSTGLLASGCIFGGGGGDKDKQRAAAAAQAAAVAPAPAVAAPAQHAPEKLASAKRADDAVARALAPKDSAVQWRQGDALTLGDIEPRRARQTRVPAVPQAPAPPPVARQESHQPMADAPGEIAVRNAPPPAPEADAAAANGSADAVANGPLEVGAAKQAGQSSAVTVAEQGEAIVSKASIGEMAKGSNDPVANRVAQRLRENPGDVPAHLDHQLLRFLTEEQAPDLAALSTLPAEDRELLTALVDGLSNFRTGLRADNNVLHSKKVRPLLDMAARLRSQAELWIPTIALCGRVRGYGVYEPMTNQFVAGASHEMLVYCEVANFASQQNDTGMWEVKLSQEAVLYKDDGQKVWANKRETRVDRARNRRQDFCVAQRVILPANLPVDRYILKVTITDEQVKRLAEATIPIELVAQLDPQQQQQQQQQQQGAPANTGPIARPDAGTEQEPRTAGFTSGQVESLETK